MALTLIKDILPFRLAGNPAFIEVQTDKQAQPNIRVELAFAYVYFGGTLLSVGPDAITPASNGRCLFEVSEYFNSPLIPGFTFPATDTFTFHNTSCKFKAVFSEWYGNPVAQGAAMVVSTDYYPVKGKIPEYFHHLFYATYASFYAKITGGDARLSLEHLRAKADGKTFERIIQKADTLKIFFQAPADTTELKLRLVLTFTDGTTANYDIAAATQALKGQVVEVETGYNFYDLDAYIATNYPTKALAYYTAKVLNISTLLVPDHRYIPTSTHFPNRREFLFLNSMGGYDTFVATGEAEREVEYNYELAQTPYWPQNLSPGPAFLKNLFTESRETIKANTGFITRAQLEWLPEFFASTEVYEILNGRLIPIVFNPAAIMRGKDRSGLHRVDFEYRQLPQLENETGYVPPVVGQLYGGGIVASVIGKDVLILQLTYPTGATNWDNASAQAAASEAGGYSDWRLPTRSELTTIRMNVYLSHNATAQLEDYYHWSSEAEPEDAWATQMNPNTELLSPKTSTYYYRPVHKITLP